MKWTDESDRAPEPVDLDAWRAEAGACAPLDAAASPAPWAFDSYSTVFSAPVVAEYDRMVAAIPDDAPDDDPRWAAIPTTWVYRVPVVCGDTAAARGIADARWAEAARTGWPRDAARVGVLCERVAAWRTYALAVNVLRLSEGCVEEEEYARLHEEHDRAWRAVLAVEPEAAKR